jgi:hypothetical protein
MQVNTADVLRVGRGRRLNTSKKSRRGSRIIDDYVQSDNEPAKFSSVEFEI